MKKFFTLLLAIFFISNISAQKSPGKNHEKLKISCKTCHICDVPTKDDPCLVLCPRDKIPTVYQKPEQTRELIVIDQINDRYGPVYFSHKLHAQMSVMSGGCENCHHHNTSGPILLCNTCHKPERKREDVSLPDLKGAYHRQCMECHREWSHDTGCNTCHTLKKNVKDVKNGNIRKRYQGKDHPPVLEPTYLMYKTNTNKGRLVTFYHDDHTMKFGLKCAGCHKQENCTRCHDVSNISKVKSKTVNTKKSFEEQHKNCISCHKEDNCTSCHSGSKLEPFDHEKKTGWALSKYHLNIGCIKCHGNKLPYNQIERSCVSCHNGWSSETFNHTITGLELDGNHLELNCDDCHLEKNFTEKPSCINCHESYEYPKQKPGKIVKNK